MGEGWCGVKRIRGKALIRGGAHGMSLWALLWAGCLSRVFLVPSGPVCVSVNAVGASFECDGVRSGARVYSEAPGGEKSESGGGGSSSSSSDRSSKGGRKGRATAAVCSPGATRVSSRRVAKAVAGRWRRAQHAVCWAMPRWREHATEAARSCSSCQLGTGGDCGLRRDVHRGGLMEPAAGPAQAGS